MDEFLKLWELQQLDHQLDEFQKAITTIRKSKKLIELERQKKSIHDALGSEAETLAVCKKELQQGEQTLDSLNAHIAEIDIQMYSSENKGRELQFIVQDKDNHIELVEQTENKIIALIELNEQIDKRRASLKRKLKATQAKLSTLCTELNDEIRVIHSKTKELKLERDALAPQIELKLYKEYTHKYGRLRGILVATVGQTPLCQGCNVRLSQRVYKAVLANKKIKCEECGRYLIHM